jgi:hypothetical protein
VAGNVHKTLKEPQKQILGNAIFHTKKLIISLVKDDIKIVNGNRVPVYNNNKNHPTIINVDQFNSWYIDDPTFNVPIPTTVTVSNADTCDTLLFRYDNSNFYPVDGKGFGNYWNNHNYGFTYASNMRFTYQVFVFCD